METEPYRAVLRFPRNPTGCDYVVGDIHGCFSQLERRLTQLEFDPARDRLFSVGDLIDRGPASIQALAWLHKPWFHACLGNHEAMLLVLGEQWRAQPDWLLANGGEWWFELDAAQQAEFRAGFRQLPFAMEVETGHGSVAIVHADVSAGQNWPQFRQALEAGDEHARATAIWSRSRADGLVRHGVQGIDRVVCGHTIHAGGVVVRGNVWFVDTGSFLAPEGDTLTVLALSDLFADPAESSCTG